MLKKWLRRFIRNYLNYRIVSCEKCGCLILKVNALQGDAEIRKKTHIVGWDFDDIITTCEDYIHYPYYCKIHSIETVNNKN